MNGHIVAPFRRRPGLFHPPQPTTSTPRPGWGGAPLGAGRHAVRQRAPSVRAISLHWTRYCPSTRRDLAVAYGRAGRRAEAITKLEQTLADQKQVLGANHPGTLATRHYLASNYLKTGRVAEAITRYQRTLTERERVLGPDHPDTLATRHALAMSHQTDKGVGPQPSDP